MTAREVARKTDGQVSGNRKRRPRGRPKGLRISVTAPKHLLAIAERLKLFNAVLTYRDAALELSQRHGFSISAGTIHKVAHGWEPKSARLRRVFGLPALAPAPCCPDCGIPHITRRCPRRRKPARARRDWKGTALVLLAAWLASGLDAGENAPRR